MGVAKKVFLQIRVDRALATQPRESALCFMAQLNFFKFARFCVAADSVPAFNRNLHKVGPRADSNFQASRRDKLSLVSRVSPENSKDGGHVGIVNGLLFTLEQTRDMAAAQTGFTRKVRLLETMPFRQTVQRGAEIAHNFF